MIRKHTLKKTMMCIGLYLIVCGIFANISYAETIVDSGSCGKRGSDISWSINSSGVLTISGNGEMYDWSNSYNVPWQSYVAYIKKVVIEYGVENISNWSFYNCTKLTDIYIPDSVTTINDDAFYYCEKLQNIELPKNLEYLGGGVFANCECLENIIIPDTVSYIGMNAFGKCYNLKSIHLPHSLTSLSRNIFSHCENIKNIEIPYGVTVIESWAFDYCYELTDLVIPETVTKIEYGAFDYCESLKNIYFSGSEEQLSSIKNRFPNNKNLVVKSEYVFSSEIPSIANNTYYFNIVYNAKSSPQPLIIATLYNKDGCLIETSNTIYNNTTIAIPYNENAYFYKLFLWTDFSTISPICENYEAMLQ